MPKKAFRTYIKHEGLSHAGFYGKIIASNVTCSNVTYRYLVATRIPVAGADNILLFLTNTEPANEDGPFYKIVLPDANIQGTFNISDFDGIAETTSKAKFYRGISPRIEENGPTETGFYVACTTLSDSQWTAAYVAYAIADGQESIITQNQYTVGDCLGWFVAMPYPHPDLSNQSSFVEMPDPIFSLVLNPYYYGGQKLCVIKSDVIELRNVRGGRQASYVPVTSYANIITDGHYAGYKTFWDTELMSPVPFSTKPVNNDFAYDIEIPNSYGFRIHDIYAVNRMMTYAILNEYGIPNDFYVTYGLRTSLTEATTPIVDLGSIENAVYNFLDNDSVDLAYGFYNANDNTYQQVYFTTLSARDVPLNDPILSNVYLIPNNFTNTYTTGGGIYADRSTMYTTVMSIRQMRFFLDDEQSGLFHIMRQRNESDYNMFYFAVISGTTSQISTSCAKFDSLVGTYTPGDLFFSITSHDHPNYSNKTYFTSTSFNYVWSYLNARNNSITTNLMYFKLDEIPAAFRLGQSISSICDMFRPHILLPNNIFTSEYTFGPTIRNAGTTYHEVLEFKCNTPNNRSDGDVQCPSIQHRDQATYMGSTDVSVSQLFNQEKMSSMSNYVFEIYDDSDNLIESKSASYIGPFHPRYQGLTGTVWHSYDSLLSSYQQVGRFRWEFDVIYNVDINFSTYTQDQLDLVFDYFTKPLHTNISNNLILSSATTFGKD